jgi:hypothetical protein
MSTLALAPLRQSPATAAWERTILKEVLSTAKAAAAVRATTSSDSTGIIHSFLISVEDSLLFGLHSPLGIDAFTASTKR